MDKEEYKLYKINVAEICFNNNVPTENAKMLTNFIEKLEQQVKKQKEVINKVNKYLNEYDVFKVFSFPLMKRWEEEQIKSSIDYEFKTSLVKDLKDILKEVSE